MFAFRCNTVIWLFDATRMFETLVGPAIYIELITQNVSRENKCILPHSSMELVSYNLDAAEIQQCSSCAHKRNWPHKKDSWKLLHCASVGNIQTSLSTFYQLLYFAQWPSTWVHVLSALVLWREGTPSVTNYYKSL